MVIMETTMPTTGVNPPSDHKNPGVNSELLARAAELRREVEKLGFAEESGYSIAPALGGNVIRRTNGTSTVARRSPFSAVPVRAN